MRWERDFSLVRVHLEWYQNDRCDWCLGVEDDASRTVLGIIETAVRSSAKSVRLLDKVRDSQADTGQILEVVTDHGSEFYAPNRDDRGEASHAFEEYLDEHAIKHILCKIGRPQSNGKLEVFFQTYDKQRWRFAGLCEFLEYYNTERPHQSLKYDDLETPAEAYDRLLPNAEDAAVLAVADGGDHGTK